ncbi:bifunctional DNA-formamidopyrimidine glycosylase/DNA-(apurinic or apyrimidinic site) lyase [Legionella israelensis]|uniref:Formamidopyrimidine-DNA glycosylase n=1 Tax=Legionella israelensis TaxID=454 RepID=A0AAX1EJJ0_9GAMM|nr:bifunctional DNA-formamidopyrimidine glycosylase/DNA-(apurinic or apyrimidinic site) lyase [Legionella israelensis]QBR84972.1 bifunctional DNA-formamidopyrimidine glycosylase/DNA-(apurinic or apyrimidinic site) lyase [Legionella israelensis]QDP73500.1 bifunctional DNA-formamidopyrimidine glycosylase/DNA-(apurinic or apyrimidinic site) lyase [Legionella israelensis]
MPELPEVETTKQGIRPFLVNQTIKAIIVRQPKLRYPVSADIEQCINQSLLEVSRRGKYLLLHLSKGALLIHLGMSGHLRILTSKLAAGKHDHIDLILNNDHVLRYCDPRRFGFWLFIPENPCEHPFLKNLGPEPLSKTFNGKYLYNVSRHKKTAIKSLLMSNEMVVGIGNIYATESLYLAGIHPQIAAEKLTMQDSHHLVACIKKVLRQAVNAGGTTLKDFYGISGKPGYFAQSLLVYGRKNQPCIKCNNLIASIKINGRNSAYCPFCQIP